MTTMTTVSVAVCETFDTPVAGFGDGPADHAGVLLNRIKRSVRIPGHGLNFEVLFRDCRREELDNEFSLEFHIAERDFRAVLERGAIDLIGACRRWLEDHAGGVRGSAPHVLSIGHFDGAPVHRLAA